MAQDKFLSNSKNKTSLIRLLTEFFISRQIAVVQADDDAVRLIVTRAIEMHTEGSKMLN